MNKRYRLGEIEEAVSEMEELIDTQDDIAEIDDDFQIVVSGWSVYVERLNLTLRQGVACIWDTEAGLFMPDFDVTIVYEGNIETQEWLYYEQDGMVCSFSTSDLSSCFSSNVCSNSFMSWFVFLSPVVHQKKETAIMAIPAVISSPATTFLMLIEFHSYLFLFLSGI